ncbi:MAG: tol-pal system-associated acyl-CoA thioesterase [Proteobacteria bacterium]|nr:tol-pal system-associated acyl-CoA thioesterase [Pseudomonadota bacterium]
MTRGRSFHLPVRVYWEDTDAGGVVYYANYLKFMERARSEWLRSLGMDQAALASEERIQFAVVEAQVRYRQPAKYDDLLDVSATVESWKGASVSFRQEIRRSTDLVLLADATIRAACLDSDSLRPRPLPPVLLEELKRE